MRLKPTWVLTNQMAVLTTRIAETEALLSTANTNSPSQQTSLRQNRFLRDVADGLCWHGGSTPWPK